MFSKEKLTIGFNRLLRKLFYNTAFWYFSFLLYRFLTGEQQIFNIHLNFLSIDNIHLVTLILSICISVILAFVDGLFPYRIRRFFPRQLFVFIKSVLYLASVFFLILIAAKLPVTVITEKDYDTVLEVIPDLDLPFARFLVYFYISGFLMTFFNEVVRKVGRGNFRNWLFGMLSKPMEQERIFMFIDMKASTTIAEKIGHKKFSHLVQDVFNDLSIVDNYHGDIYQYLGDGAIISWSLKQGLKNANFMRAFFAFQQVVDRRKRYYNRKYDLEPKFKAGVHVGKVMVLQIGQIRKDISYNGDTLNTSARIESMCNELKQNFLISGTLYEMVADNKAFTYKLHDGVKLKGKRQSVDIYSVKMKKG